MFKLNTLQNILYAEYKCTGTLQNICTGTLQNIWYEVYPFQGILHELNKNHDVIKLVTQSLIKLHKQALVTAGDGQLGPDSIVDTRYPHSEVSIPPPPDTHTPR